MPIRTVLFTALSKYDGNKVRRLRAREFHQIAGRAGRAGFDTIGYVACQAPEHDVENAKALAKIGDDPKRRRGYARKKPPEGFVGWSEETFEKLQNAEPEPLNSRFKVSNAMLLAVINRPGDCFQAMKHLLTDNHEDRKWQRRHISQAIAIYRSLLAGGVVEQLAEPDEQGRRARLTIDLQEDFALNQALSTFALAAFELLDRDSPTLRAGHGLDRRVHPRRPAPDPVRPAQARPGARPSRQMKADGIEYEERMERARRDHVPDAAGEPAARRVRDLPAGPSVGGRLHGQPQVRWCVTCTSGR